MKHLLLFLALLVPVSVVAQTTITVNTTQVRPIERPGINLGGPFCYGPMQMLKSLNYCGFGYMNQGYWQLSFDLSSSGTQTPTSLFSNAFNPLAYLTNQFVTAGYTVVTQLGVVLGTCTPTGNPPSGCITASTANTSSPGITFTLATPLSATPTGGNNTANSDLLIVRGRYGQGLTTPDDMNSFLTGTRSWNYTDVSPASSNQNQSLDIANGHAEWFLDQLNNWLPGGTGQTNYLNINCAASGAASCIGTWKAKCLTAGCTIGYSLIRAGGNTFLSGTDSPTFNVTPGAGWTTFTHTLSNATETGSQNGQLPLILTITGRALIQDVDVIEGTAIGNTTALTDAAVTALALTNAGETRSMTPFQWPTYVAAMTGKGLTEGGGGVSVGDINSINRTAFGVPIMYQDALNLDYYLGWNSWLTIGHFNTASDWTLLGNYLTDTSRGPSGQSWIQAFKAKGKHIRLEDGNEPWNSGAGGNQDSGNGLAYGALSGPKMTAIRAVAGYDSTVIDLIMDGWGAGNQCTSNFGWCKNALTAAGCTTGTQTSCPDYMDMGAYMLGTLDSLTDPYKDVVAETQNWTSVAAGSLTTPSNSVLAAQQSMVSVRGLKGIGVYEQSLSPNVGTATPTQAQMNGISGGVNWGLNIVQEAALEIANSGMTGPSNFFAFVDQPYNGGTGGTAMTSWTCMSIMAAGPGQAFPSAYRPACIYLRGFNTALGASPSLLSFSQSGSPTFSYPLSQGGTIMANPSVQIIEPFASIDTATGNPELTVWNNDETNPQAIVFAGTGPPFGTVTKRVFGGTSNAVTDNNNNLVLNNVVATTPTVVYPSPTTLSSPTGDTLEPHSMTIYTWTAGTPTLAAPTFTPPAGTYSSTQTVTINCSAGATCVYTTDGSTPTATPPGTPTHGTVYTTPITVSTTQTIQAIATEVGFFNSSVASATYTIAPPAATPTFSPAAGTYASVQTVTISDTTPSSTIHYTTDGTTPTLASTTYTAPITVATSQTVKAVAIASGFSLSAVGTAVYTITLPQAASVTFSPAPGTYPTAQSVTLATITSGATICWKAGSAPSATVPGTCDVGSNTYSAAIPVSASQTIFALATKAGFINSAVTQASYVIEVPAATPTFSPIAGTYTSVQSVTILDVTPSASIFYTINGTTPTPSSTPYTGPIAVNVSTTIKAIVTAPGFLNSAVGTAVYVLNLPAAGTPTFTPVAGTYTSPQSVVIASSTAGAAIFYTTDGSAPTPASTPYTGAISVGVSQTIKAIATKVGFSNSAVGTAVYTITLPQVATPTFSPPAGPYSTAQSVVISDMTAGASIYYTTDGSTPTPSSTLYTGPITVSTSQTVQAIGVLSGFVNSAVGSAAYTITTIAPCFSLFGNVQLNGALSFPCPQ